MPEKLCRGPLGSRIQADSRLVRRAVPGGGRAHRVGIRYRGRVQVGRTAGDGRRTVRGGHSFRCTRPGAPAEPCTGGLLMRRAPCTGRIATAGRSTQAGGESSARAAGKGCRRTRAGVLLEAPSGKFQRPASAGRRPSSFPVRNHTGKLQAHSRCCKVIRVTNAPSAAARPGESGRASATGRTRSRNGLQVSGLSAGRGPPLRRKTRAATEVNSSRFSRRVSSCGNPGTFWSSFRKLPERCRPSTPGCRTVEGRGLSRPFRRFQLVDDVAEGMGTALTEAVSPFRTAPSRPGRSAAAKRKIRSSPRRQRPRIRGLGPGSPIRWGTFSGSGRQRDGGLGGLCQEWRQVPASLVGGNPLLALVRKEKTGRRPPPCTDGRSG